MYTLIVVDMQPGFDTAYRSRVQKNCIKAIKQAVKDEAHILFLEYDGYEATLPSLIEAASLNHSFTVLTKCTDDGSNEVERNCRREKRPFSFKVCGINTDCCVRSTVEGLTARFPMSKIDVISDACDSNWFHLNGLEAMRKLGGNVNVL